MLIFAFAVGHCVLCFLWWFWIRGQMRALFSFWHTLYSLHEGNSKARNPGHLPVESHHYLLITSCVIWNSNFTNYFYSYITELSIHLKVYSIFVLKILPHLSLFWNFPFISHHPWPFHLLFSVLLIRLTPPIFPKFCFKIICLIDFIIIPHRLHLHWLAHAENGTFSACEYY